MHAISRGTEQRQEYAVWVLVTGLLWLPAAPMRAQSPTKDVPPDGPPQMAVLYAHGFNDDGASWGVGSVSGSALLSELRSQYQNSTNSPSRFLSRYGLESYAIQWAAASPDEYSDPYATAEEGFAFLADETQLKRETDWIGLTRALHNRARPTYIDLAWVDELNLLNPFLSLDVLLPEYVPIELALTNPWLVAGLLPPPAVVQSGRRAYYLALTANVNNYNDSGTADDQSTDLLDLLREERQDGGRLGAYRQVNIVTHSKGSLMTRAMLAKAEAASREDAEYVANVIYNAPPFAGSSLAELLTFLYEPTLVLRSHLANPWLSQTFDEIFFTLDAPNPRLGDHYRAFLRVFCAAFGVNWDELEATSPEVRNQIDFLNVFETTTLILNQLANAPPGTTSALLGNTVALVLNLVRPVLTHAAGIPAFPTAQADLSPFSTPGFLTGFPNSTSQVQFLNIGVSSPLGLRTVLWPNLSSAAIAANPSVVHDVGSLVGTSNDTYVAYGSARLLTETDAFGPRYKLHGVFPTLGHGDMASAMVVLGTNWLSVLLAPPTTLHLSGSIDTVSDNDRIYRVTQDTLFSFTSANFTTNVGVHSLAIAAAAHEYRFVPRYTDDLPPSPWTVLSPGGSQAFGAALASASFENQPVFMQWRAVQANGSKEMIRQAMILLDVAAPQVLKTDMLGLASEIVRQDPRKLSTGRSIRSGFFSQLPQRNSDLLAVQAVGEPEWMIRNPAAKALVAVFDRRGSVEYAWNDPGFTNPTRADNVNSLFLVLDSLSEGLQTLTFEPFVEVGSIEERGPRQTLRILVDATPPEHSFVGRRTDAIGYRVGPATPLVYRSQDLESGGARGAVSVVGFSNTTFQSGRVFRLGETDLLAQLQGAPGGSNLVGGFITFHAAATDRVGNVSSTNVQAYYDFTPPLLTNVMVEGGLPIAGGFRVFTNLVEMSVDLREPNSSEFLPPFASIVNVDAGHVGATAPFAFQAAVGAFARFTGTVALVEGTNVLQVGSRDVFGNLGVLPLLVVYSRPDASDTLPLTVWTPRIDDMTSVFYDPNGNPTNFIVGAIDAVSMSWDGRRFLFQSSGNGFVPGDNNQQADIFLSEAGRIRRVNTGPNGEQAFGGQSQAPALSGDGRYAFFASSATNLVPGTSNVNAYVKEIDSGRIAVISRRSDGAPVNRLAGVFELAPTQNGRYVFFAARNDAYVSGLTDGNTGRDIYMVDLDPDGNGDYFDSAYVTVAISTATPTTTGNGESRSPAVSADGRYLTFVTLATNLHPDLAVNGSTLDAVLMKFTGSALAGTLNVLSNRALYVVNRDSVAGGSVLSQGVEGLGLGPDGDTVLLGTRGNVLFSGDTNSVATGWDVYSSVGEAFGLASVSNRLLSWQSRGAGGTQSSTPAVTGSPRRLTVARDLRPGAFFNNKIAWISDHSNLVAGDGNGVYDLFIGTAGGLGVMPMNPPVANWIASNITSGASVLDGGLTPCGRYAWWVSTQDYVTPYSPSSRMNLFVRRIDPPLTNTLTLATSGSGHVVDASSGAMVPTGAVQRLDTDVLRLRAVSASGWRFLQWSGVDASTGSLADVHMVTQRTATATFVPADRPITSNRVVSILEDEAAPPLVPVIADRDPGELHTLSITGQPTGGVVVISNGAFLYTPNPNFHGTDRFRFQVTDAYGLQLASSATVTVNVAPVNDPPVIVSQALKLLASGQVGPFMPAIEDPDAGDTFVFSILVPAAHGTATADAMGLSYAPDEDYSGPDSFTFQVADAAGATASAQVVVDVLALPVIEGVGAGIGQGIFEIDLGGLPDDVGYTVEYLEDLTTGNWQPIPPADQWPSTSDVFEDSLLEPRKNYRLRFEILP